MAPPNEELLAFLSEMDNDWVLEPTPITSKPRARRSRRVDLLNVRQEVAELQNELQLLHEKLEFRESLTANRSSCGLDWKALALSEGIRKRRTDEENARLRRRVEERARLVRRIAVLMQQQVEIVPKSVETDFCIKSVDLQNEAHVYGVLHACLDLRYRDDLNTIVQQCNAQSVASELTRAKWKAFALGDRGVCVDFQEATAVPFSSGFIRDTIRRHAVVNSLEECKANAMRKPTSRHRSLANTALETGRRLILRRIVSVGKEMIMLWEDAACWQSNTTSFRAWVRSSGWAFVSPVAGHADELSFICTGGLIQIHAADGLRITSSDAQVKSIVQCMRRVQRSRAACMEAALLLSSRERNSRV